MESFSRYLLAEGVVDEEVLDAAVRLQMLHGGHMATSLFETGATGDRGLQQLLATFHGLVLGPTGRLDEPPPSLWDLLPRAVARRFRCFPVDRTEVGLIVAVAAPLEEACARALAQTVQLPVVPVQVTPLRLREALFRYVDLDLTERERWLVGMLEAGRRPHRGARDSLVRETAAALQTGTPYRRMSIRPEGIRRSSRQPLPRLPSPDEVKEQLQTEGYGANLDTLEGVGPSEGPFVESEKPDRSSSIPASVDDPGRITHPYDAEEPPPSRSGKRNTQPWHDDEQDETPMSVSGEFSASLREQETPSHDARIHEEHRRFRHRGPFTRAQADLAAKQATDVHLVLEIFARYARQFFDRAILFVILGETFELRLAHGVRADLADLSFPMAEDGRLRDAYLEGDPIVGPLGRSGTDATLRDCLGIRNDTSVAIVPLCIRERVVAIFFGDDLTTDVDRAAVDDVTDFTEVCAGEITRLIIARKHES